jgi:hypothetical protein
MSMTSPTPDARVKPALGLEYAVSQNQETTHDGCHDLFAVLTRRLSKSLIIGLQRIAATAGM